MSANKADCCLGLFQSMHHSGVARRQTSSFIRDPTKSTLFLSRYPIMSVPSCSGKDGLLRTLLIAWTQAA